MRENRLRVLVIEDDPERVQLLEEAFAEMEELRFSRPAYPACTHDYALDWHEAIGRLTAGAESQALPPDAILFNASHDTTASPSASNAFRALRAASPSSAIVLVVARGDESLALGLIKMGAQDYLIESEIDCGPLARCLRCAVERSRLDWSRQSVAMLDDLTGLYNRRGVAMLAERDDRLAAALHLRRWSLELRMDLPAALGGSGNGIDGDLRRLELAEQLNELSAAGLLAGRAADDAFVLFGLSPTGPEANASAEQAAQRLREQCIARGIPVSVRVAAHTAIQAEPMRESMS